MPTPNAETATPFVVPGSGLQSTLVWDVVLRMAAVLCRQAGATEAERSLFALAAHLPTLATLAEAGVRARVPNAETDAEHQARCGASPCPRCDAMIAAAMARRSDGETEDDSTVSDEDVDRAMLVYERNAGTWHRTALRRVLKADRTRNRTAPARAEAVTDAQ